MTRPIKEGRTGLCTKINQNLCSYAPGFYHFFYTRTFVLVLQLWNWFIQASDTLSRHFQGCRAAWHSSNFYSISCIESAAPKQPAIDCSRHWEAQKISTLPSPFHWISGPMSGLGFMWPQYLVSSHVQSKSMCDHQFHRPFALLGKKTARQLRWVWVHELNLCKKWDLATLEAEMAKVQVVHVKTFPKSW